MSLNVGALMAHESVKALSAAFRGHQLHLVGGSVRELATGGDFDDLDFATNVRPDDAIKLVSHLGTVWEVGKAFGTIGVNVCGQKVEITTYRKDTYDRTSRKPSVQFGDTLLDDLSRRDFTVNAVAIDAHTGVVFDPFHGLDDLKAGVLRTPLDPVETICDDPLRAVRAVRFAVVRNLQPVHALQTAIRNNAVWLNMVSTERITAELMKISAHGRSRVLAAHSLANTLGIDWHMFGHLPIKACGQPDINLDDPVANFAVAIELGSDTDVYYECVKLRFPHKDARIIADIVRIQERLAGAASMRHIARQATDDVLVPAVRALGVDGLLSNCLKMTFDGRRVYRGPLPVDGNDFLAAGLKGAEVGLALGAVTEAFLEDPYITRERAIVLGVESAERRTANV